MIIHPTIRPVAIDEIETVAKIHITSWRHAYKGIIADEVLHQLSLSQRTEFWGKINHNIGPLFKGEILVAVEHKRILGFLSWGISRDEDFPDYAEVYALYVDPSFIHKGVGTELMRTMISHLRDRGFSKFYLWSLEQNLKAHQAFLAWGAIKSNTRSMEMKIGGAVYPQIAFIWASLPWSQNE